MLLLNGEKISFKENINLKSFLQLHNFDTDMVVVEVNNQLVKRKDFENFLLEDEAKIEVFAFIGGG